MNAASPHGDRIADLRQQLAEATTALVASICGDTPEPRMATSYIYRLVSSTPRVTWTAEQIREALEPKCPVLFKTIASTLSRLHRRGEIERVQYGHYRAVAKYRAAETGQP